MEEENGGLVVEKITIPTIWRKNKPTDNYEGRRMGGSLQKCTRNNMTAHVFFGGFQYFKRKYNGGCDECIG